MKARAAEEELEPFGTVPLSKRVHNWIERTEAGIQIDVISSVLSVLTVITYMVSHLCAVQLRRQRTMYAGTAGPHTSSTW